MVMKIFGFHKSTCTARVMVCMEELGAEYELVELNVAEAEHKGEAHLARNPFGQIPAFEDGDVKLFESRAISKYVIRKYKGSSPDLLHLGNLKEAAAVDLGLEIECHHYNPAISAIVAQCIFIPMHGGTPDQKIIDTNVEALGKVLDVYEHRLSESKYIAGDFFSFADITHFPYTFYLFLTPHSSLITSRPHVKAWWEALLARPAVAKVAAIMKG